MNRPPSAPSGRAATSNLSGESPLGADLARPWAIVPVRGLEAAKSRLGGWLDAEERRDLVVRLLRRAVAASSASRRIVGTIAVSPDREALALARSLGAVVVEQADGELNEALELGRAAAIAARATAVLVLPADLPDVTGEALDALIEAGQAAARPDRPLVGLVGDRHGSGTNALLVSPALAIGFRFGSGSLAAHRAAAADAGAVLIEPRGPLELDVDTPDDLLAAGPGLMAPDPDLEAALEPDLDAALGDVVGDAS